MIIYQIYLISDNIEGLKMRIVEIVEKFPKLSGLSELATKDLSYKTEKGLIPITDKKLDSFIKPKDIIIFDLEFSEIWLEIEMTLRSEENNLKICFEMKVLMESYISELKNILIKMGIKYWAAYLFDIYKNSEDYEYYLFESYTLILPDKQINLNNINNIELDNFHGTIILLMSNNLEKVKDIFEFQRKVSCKIEIEFLNLNYIIYRELTRLSAEKINKSSWLNTINFFKKKVLKIFINEYLKKFCDYDIKNTNVAKHKNILWKWNDENVKTSIL